MKKKGKFFVVEMRRLIPLMFLLVLLLSLTVYDNFFRAEQVVAPPEEDPGGIMFTTTDSGILAPPVSFNLVAEHDEWARVSQDMGLALPDYPFNAADEIAVFAVNGAIHNLNVLPAAEKGVEIRVEVEPKENYYHVITVDRRDVDHAGAVWNFVDNENRLLSRIVPFWEQKNGAENEEAGADAVENQEKVK